MSSTRIFPNIRYGFFSHAMRSNVEHATLHNPRTMTGIMEQGWINDVEYLSQVQKQLCPWMSIKVNNKITPSFLTVKQIEPERDYQLKLGNKWCQYSLLYILKSSGDVYFKTSTPISSTERSVYCTTEPTYLSGKHLELTKRRLKWNTIKLVESDAVIFTQFNQWHQFTHAPPETLVIMFNYVPVNQNTSII